MTIAEQLTELNENLGEIHSEIIIQDELIQQINTLLGQYELIETALPIAENHTF